MKALEGANLALRFLLELTAIGIAGYWGWETGEGVMRAVLGGASVAVVIVVWALFVAPKATIDVPRPVRLAIEFPVWLAAGAALYATDHETLAVAFVAAALVSGTLNYIRVSAAPNT